MTRARAPRDRTRALRATLALALALFASSAAATPSRASARAYDVGTLRAWKVPRGTLAQGRAAGSFVLASDAAPGRYSEASMVTEAALPYQLSARWRRLGPEAGRSMHVLVAGGTVLIKSGAIAFYPNDDAGFAWAGWMPLPGYAANAEHALVVRQDAREITVSLDGAVVARFTPSLVRETAHVGFGMKSAPGLRSSIYLRDVALAPASAPAQ